MKKRNLLLIAICSIAILAAGISLTIMNQNKQNITARRPMVFADNLLYLGTGNAITEDINTLDILGTIDSTVSVSEVPKKEGQCNFGKTGMKYAKYKDGLAVMIDGQWIFFEPETNQ